MSAGEEGKFLLNLSAPRVQYGALCWRKHRGRLQVLLVTSRDTGRWIIPKGWPIDGLSPAETALREAWEEAGVEGEASADSLGLFPYDKMLSPERTVPCLVAVYGVHVKRLRGSFPERAQRRRKWFAPDKAAQKVTEGELGQLLSGFVPLPRGAGGS